METALEDDEIAERIDTGRAVLPRECSCLVTYGG